MKFWAIATIFSLFVVLIGLGNILTGESNFTDQAVLVIGLLGLLGFGSVVVNRVISTIKEV